MTSSTASEHDVSPASWLGILELAKKTSIDHECGCHGNLSQFSYNFYQLVQTATSQSLRLRCFLGFMDSEFHLLFSVFF